MVGTNYRSGRGLGAGSFSPPRTSQGIPMQPVPTTGQTGQPQTARWSVADAIMSQNMGDEIRAEGEWEPDDYWTDTDDIGGPQIADWDWWNTPRRDLDRTYKAEAYARLSETDDNVIDASSRFMMRNPNSLPATLSAMADEFPNVVTKLDSQEKDINQLLSMVKTIPDKYINIKRAKLAVPGAFRETEAMAPIKTVFRLVIWAEDESWEDEMRKFVQQNEQAFITAIEQMHIELKRIEEYADTMKWIAPWRRYTQWGNALNDVKMFEHDIYKFMKDNFIAELRVRFQVRSILESVIDEDDDEEDVTTEMNVMSAGNVRGVVTPLGTGPTHPKASDKQNAKKKTSERLRVGAASFGGAKIN